MMIDTTPERMRALSARLESDRARTGGGYNVQTIVQNYDVILEALRVAALVPVRPPPKQLDHHRERARKRRVFVTQCVGNIIGLMLVFDIITVDTPAIRGGLGFCLWMLVYTEGRYNR